MGNKDGDMVGTVIGDKQVTMFGAVAGICKVGDMLDIVTGSTDRPDTVCKSGNDVSFRVSRVGAGVMVTIRSLGTSVMVDTADMLDAPLTLVALIRPDAVIS